MSLLVPALSSPWHQPRLPPITGGQMTAVESTTSLPSKNLEFPLAIYKQVCVCWEMHNGFLTVDL